MPANSKKNSLLKVAIVSVHGNPMVPNHELGSDGKGGQNVYIREVGKHLSTMGCDVTWFTRSESKEEDGILCLSDTLQCRYIVAGPREHVNRDFLFPYLDEFIEKVKVHRGEFDVVFTGYWLSAFVGMSLGLPHAHSHMSCGVMKYQKTAMPSIGPTRLRVEHLVNQQANIIISQTMTERALTRPKVSALIPCGIMADIFTKIDRQTSRNNLGYEDDTLHVLYVGRFAPQKGVQYAIEAMRETTVPHTFRLAGRCDDLGLMADNPEMRFLGPKSPAECAELMAAADVLLMPSIYEPFGMVAIEAMAAGTCLIVTTVGGLDENIEHGINGLKVPPEDPEAIRKSFEELAGDPELRRKIRRHNRKYALKKYSWRSVATEIKQELEKIQGEPRLEAGSDVIRKKMKAIDTPTILKPFAHIHPPTISTDIISKSHG